MQLRVTKKKKKRQKESNNSREDSKSSPDHFIPIYFWKIVKVPLWKKNVLNYLKGLYLSKLKKILEK